MSSTPHTAVPQGASGLRDGESDAGTSTAAGGAPNRPGHLSPPLNWADERLGAAKGIRFLMRKIFPDHWSFMLGEIAMYSMIICLITGTFLTLWFVPSMAHVTYEGSYTALQGTPMSEAYATTLDISFDVRGGLLLRQLHHWAALLFIVAILLHMARVFFTGAFRKPREINWLIGVALSLVAIIEGFAGYSLPDDLLSGTGLRAAEGFVQSIPILGSYMSFLMFGGVFPGEEIIPRLYIAHVLLLPAVLVGLLTVHLILLVVHKHTQYPGPGRTNENVVGYPLMPVYMAKAGGFFFIVFGITALISALIQINPVWVYGPYNPSQVTAGVQPDWYMWFADGALRLLPGWLEFQLFGITFSMNIFLGAVALIPILWGILAVYPFVEQWVTGDKREHHLLDRPRNAPVRTGLGMAFVTFYTALALATVNDLLAIRLGLSINGITIALRTTAVLGPIVVFFITRRICLSLQRADREKVLHGRETGRIVRTAEGRFYEVHEPLDPHTRWTLVQHEPLAPLALPAGGRGPLAPLRDRLRRFYFQDRIDPVTPAELAAAHHHGDHDALESTPAAGALPEGESTAAERADTDAESGAVSSPRREDRPRD